MSSIHMGRVMRKHAFCICENKGADQLHVPRSLSVPLFSLQILQSPYFLNFKPLSVFCVCTAGLCQTRSEITKTDFVALQLIYNQNSMTLAILYGKAGWFKSLSETSRTGFLRMRLQLYEPRCEKTGFLHMRKQRRRSASR